MLDSIVSMGIRDRSSDPRNAVLAYGVLKFRPGKLSTVVIKDGTRTRVPKDPLLNEDCHDVFRRLRGNWYHLHVTGTLVYAGKCQDFILFLVVVGLLSLIHI